MRTLLYGGVSLEEVVIAYVLALGILVVCGRKPVRDDEETTNSY
jgi:hypothetical protein